MRARLPTTVAVLLCLLLFAKGVATTWDLSWPYDVDQFRDIAFAQTIADGHPLQDSFYRGEWTWYNPLLPAVVALTSKLTGASIPIIEARGGPYFNLAAPAAFFALLATLFDAEVALAGVAVLLFGVRGDSWQTPGYSPWLFGSAFAQPFFYLTIAASVRALDTHRRSWFVIAGTLLGLTFLGHAAPAIIAGVVLLTGVVTRALTNRSEAGLVLRGFLLSCGLAVLVSSPFLVAIGGHYHFKIRHAVPLLWNDPALPRDDWRPVAHLLLSRPYLVAGIVAGLVCMTAVTRYRRHWAVLASWLAAAGTFFLYNQFVVLNARRWGVEAPPLAPPHHFLLYWRAAEAALAGLGVAGVVALLARKWPRAARPALCVTVCLMAAVSYPSIAAGNDYTAHRRQALTQLPTNELREVIPWIRAHTSPNAVFLADEGTALTLVGPSGRKLVVVPSFFANPYVAWRPRKDAEQAMWAALVADDCRLFGAYAERYAVSYVLTAARRTPPVESGRCGLVPTTFMTPTLEIYTIRGKR